MIPLVEMKCMEMWMKTGTGICMASCPFSQGVDPKLQKNIKGNKDIIKKSSPQIVRCSLRFYWVGDLEKSAIGFFV